ncbi:MAG: DnaA regulatory inactivator Hda [Nevskiaceae bacterium]|jgi:DnaA family protein|nr:DnaA regulatory inactivator Hda [Nevskiaceae bacterium]
MQQLPLGVRLNDRATFASFLTGGNQRAVAALHELREGMLYLYGPQGSGKSHLLQAWCASMAGSAYFELQSLRALGPSVLEGAERLAAVALDGLFAVAGDADWERALFRLYNERDAMRLPTLWADALPARELGWKLPDLRSRLDAIVHVGLAPLDESQQRAALQLRAAQRGLELPEDAAVYLQRHFPRDMGSLYGLLDRLDEAALREQRRLTTPFIREVMGR